MTNNISLSPSQKIFGHDLADLILYLKFSRNHLIPKKIIIFYSQYKLRYKILTDEKSVTLSRLSIKNNQVTYTIKNLCNITFSSS